MMTKYNKHGVLRKISWGCYRGNWGGGYFEVRAQKVWSTFHNSKRHLCWVEKREMSRHRHGNKSPIDMCSCEWIFQPIFSEPVKLNFLSLKKENHLCTVLPVVANSLNIAQISKVVLAALEPWLEAKMLKMLIFLYSELHHHLSVSNLNLFKFQKL